MVRCKFVLHIDLARRIPSGSLSAAALRSQTSLLGPAASRIPLSLAVAAAASGVDVDSSPRRRLTSAADVVAVDHVARSSSLENDEEFFDQEGSPSPPSSIPETETRL